MPRILVGTGTCLETKVEESHPEKVLANDLVKTESWPPISSTGSKYNSARPAKGLETHKDAQEIDSAMSLAFQY